MSIKILHQVGHNSSWNIDSFQEEGCGDGLILSPLHQNLSSVEKLSPSTRGASIFDPQFYLPSSRKPKLQTYSFFPEVIAGGFQTSTFASHASMVAEDCIKFQEEMGFRKIVVPTRFLNQMYSDYVQRQRRFIVDAFMEAAGEKIVCLSLAVTSAMIEDSGFRNQLLNWITSYPNVDEIYFMYQHDRDTKQIHDANFLHSCISFIDEISRTGLKVIVGYTNVEGLLFASAGNLSVTMGTFENTRIFSVEKFLEAEGERRGPKARIYLAGLMNWIQLQDAKTIQNRAPAIWDSIYQRTDWADSALASPIEPTFNQPQLYKHFFKNISDHISYLKAISLPQRRIDIIERLNRARRSYAALDAAGIQLERHGRGTHIQPWLSLFM